MAMFPSRLCLWFSPQRGLLVQNGEMAHSMNLGKLLTLAVGAGRVSLAGRGGALAIIQVNVTDISESSFTSNSAVLDAGGSPVSGGAIFVEQAESAVMSGVHFDSNQCDQTGGAISMLGSSQHTLIAATFTDNRCGSEMTGMTAHWCSRKRHTGCLWRMRRYFLMRMQLPEFGP
jgi:hypothetical protein